MPKKIFILNVTGCAEESIHDIKSLLINEKFISGADILETNGSINTTGLPRGNEVTLIVPGGSSLMIARHLKGMIENLKISVGLEFNYIGFCAGAYLGMHNAHVLMANHNKMDQVLSAEFTFQAFGADCDLVSEGDAIGPFYPNTSYANHTNVAHAKNKEILPYAAQITSLATGRTASQLYVAGCGFLLAQDQPLFETVAFYSDQSSYTFTVLDKAQTIEKLPAIIRRRSSLETKTGGIFLSGPHLEANVQDSHMLRFFAPRTWDKNQGVTFSQEAYDNIRQSAEGNVAEVSEWLRDTFKG